MGLRQNGRNFADAIHQVVFENWGISIRFSLKSVLNDVINNKPSLVQVIAWRQTGDNLLSERILAKLTDAYIRVTRLKWHNSLRPVDVWVSVDCVHIGTGNAPVTSHPGPRTGCSRAVFNINRTSPHGARTAGPCTNFASPYGARRVFMHAL